ncbi:MAG: hypothetical protein Q9220_007400 [cf. Caloplaca sp. 1 TL-2023]
MRFPTSTIITLVLSILQIATAVPEPVIFKPADRAQSLSLDKVIPAGDSIILNDAFNYPIPSTPLTLYVQDTGSQLPATDILTCLHTLGVSIIAKILEQGGSSPATKLYMRSGEVAVTFTPISITWDDTGEVMDAMEKIVEHEWTWASHVAVLDARVKGRPTGVLSIVYMAPRGVEETA